MRYITYLIVLFSLSFIGCGGSEAASSDSENQNELGLEEDSLGIDLIDVENSATVVEEYKRLRKKYLAEIDEGQEDEFEVKIQGALYTTSQDLTIYNFTEYWGTEMIAIAVVTGANSHVNQVGDEEGDNYGDLSNFLQQSFPENTAFYKGNFHEAPAYQILDYKPLILTDQFNQNTYLESTSTLYFLTSELEEQPVVARTMGYGGECDYFKGFKEDFVLGKNPNRIVIAREECSYYEGCDLTHKFFYKKVWLEANLLGMSEGGPEPEVPTYFLMDFVNNPDFVKLPKAFTQLVVENGDTLYNDKQYSIAIDQTGNEKSVFVDEEDYFVAESSLLVGFKKHPNGSYTIFDREAGLNSDHYVSDKNALVEAEQNEECRELNIMLIDASKGIYLFTYPQIGTEFLFTTKTELFQMAEIETAL